MATPLQAEPAAAAPEFVEVAVDVPVRTYFTYAVPAQLAARVKPGVRLYVPFRGRPRAGLAVALVDAPSKPGLRIESVLDVLDTEPSVLPPGVALLDWVSRYYFAPPGEVMRLMLPKALRVRGKRWVEAAPAGLQGLSAGTLGDGLTERVLARLESGGRISDRVLRKEVRGLTFVRLDGLAQAGLIRLTWDDVHVDRGKRMARTLRKVGQPDEGKRVGARQRAVLELLEGRGAVPAVEVRELTGASHATLRSLISSGWVEEGKEERFRDPFRDEEVEAPRNHELTDEQTAAVAAIVSDGRFESPGRFLLQGITGSGKTVVYMECIRAAVAAGKRGLVLLPEIALTPQFVAIFRAHFGSRVAVLHSGLSDGERYDEWRRIRRGAVEVVIGARSAIYAPLADLGIIVVDEEHDGSFKQDVGVRYNARDLAFVRGQQEAAVVVLGSATPSLESLQRCRTGGCQRLLLSRRPTGQPLPDVEVIDMREVPKDEKRRAPLISPHLTALLQGAASKGQQSILFLNRRGHSTTVLCASCGESWTCPHCEIVLTYHRRPDRLACHYCDYSEPLPDTCPHCSSPEWMFFGAGTEKVSDTVPIALEHVRILRLDRDTAGGRKMREIIKQFRDGRAEVLVGTQMVAKGHDFPHVTLVGVLMADLSLRIPDFRSGERTFQLLAQVAGRAGRRQHKGRVVIQTFMPEHPVIQAAAAQDFDAFAEVELMAREALGYPPFGFLVALRFEGPDLGRVKAVAARYQAAADAALADVEGSSAVRVMGPVESPLAKMKDQHRWQMLLRHRTRGTLRQVVGQMLTRAGFASGGADAVSVYVDVDPVNLM